MPLFTVTMSRGGHGGPGRILNALAQASAAAGYPENDVFQRVIEYPETHLVVDRRYPELPRDRTPQFIILDVLISAGTAAEQKHRVRDAVVKSLGEVGIDANDIMLLFTEYDRAASTFGGGKPPPPIELTT